MLEFVSDCMLLKFCKINHNKLYILFLQIPKLCINILCLELIKKAVFMIFLIFITQAVVLLFMTDTFDLKRLLSLLFMKFVFMCSVAGFLVFVLMWIEGSIYDLASIKISERYRFLIIFCIILYVFVFYKTMRFLEENKKIKQFLANVSFSILDKHISVYGLIDSGNSLRDPVTRKPIILISKKVLNKILSENDTQEFLKTKCHCLRCETVGSSEIIIPVYKCREIKIRVGEEIKMVSCMIALVDNKFENGKYDCLLPRDLM